MLPFFLAAEGLSKNEFDPEFLGKLIQVVLVLAAVAGAYGLGKRRPSMDVDLATMQTRLGQVEQDVEEIKKTLATGTEIHRRLEANQAANTTRIEDIKHELHQLNQRMGAMPNQIAELLRNWKPKP